jgi:hypothetical protein
MPTNIKPANAVRRGAKPTRRTALINSNSNNSNNNNNNNNNNVENGHTGHCTHTSESTDVKEQNIQHEK